MKRNVALTAALGAVATSGLLLLAAPGLGVPASRLAGAVATPSPKYTRINVEDNFFDPRSTGVPQNGRVIWMWKGTNRHNIAFTKVPPGASRKGASVRTDGRWKRTFNVPGLYRYVCRYYAGMRGTLTVTPPTSGTSY